MIPLVMNVIPWGTSRNALSNLNACSLSTLWEGGRDRDLQLGII